MKAAVLSTAKLDAHFVDRVITAADAATRTARVDADLPASDKVGYVRGTPT